MSKFNETVDSRNGRTIHARPVAIMPPGTDLVPSPASSTAVLDDVGKEVESRPLVFVGENQPVIVDAEDVMRRPGGPPLRVGEIRRGVDHGISMRARANMHDVRNAATPEAALNALIAYMGTTDDVAQTTAQQPTFTNVVWVDPTAASGGTGASRNSPVNTIPSNLVPNTAYLIRGGTTLNLTSRLNVVGTAPGGNDAAGQAIVVANNYIGSYDAELFGYAAINGAGIIPTDTNARTIRVDAQNFTIADVRVVAPNTAVNNVGTAVDSRNGITVSQRSAGFRAFGSVLHMEDAADIHPIKSIGIALSGTAFFEVIGCETTGRWLNPLALAGVNQALLDAETRTSRISRNILRCGSLNKPLFIDGDCLTMGGTAQVNWGYKLVVMYNKFLGARENACDSGCHSRVIYYANEALEPTDDPLDGVIPSAFLMGTSNSNLSVRSRSSIWIGNVVRGWSRQNYTAFHSRGGMDILMMGNIVDDCWRAVNNATGDSSNMRVLQNTFVDIGAGGVFRVADSNQNWRFLNNICHTKERAAPGADTQRIYDLGGGGVGGVRGGNLLCGGRERDRTFQDIPNPGTERFPSFWFNSLDQIIDRRTYEPKRVAMLKPIAPLNVSALDALLSGYRFPCAGAVAPSDLFAI